MLGNVSYIARTQRSGDSFSAIPDFDDALKWLSAKFA